MMASYLSLLLVGVVLLVGAAQGAEWFTSRGNHCIKRCAAAERDGRQTYTCPTVDGIQKENILSTGGTGSRPGYGGGAAASAPDPVPWDYCIPAPVASLEQDEVDSSVAASIPARVNGTGDGGGQGGSSFNPGTSSGEMPTSLPGVNCVGECIRQRQTDPYMCIVDGQIGITSFYCSLKYELERLQISATNKLWCISPCLLQSGQEHYMCKTMLGMDRCSPKKDLSSKMNTCQTPCNVRLEDNNHYHCQVAVNQWETCGNWEVGKEKTNALEYTNEGQVCASPCTNVDGDTVCTYVNWLVTDTETARKASLNLYTGFCGATDGTDWTLIAIIVGAVVGGIILVAVVGLLVSRRKYSRAATEAH